MNENPRKAVKIAGVVADLLTDPRAIPVYVSTLKRKPLSVGLPWIRLKAIRFLEHHLSGEMTVFEYGSGGSTIFFAQRCRRVISVEDDSEWAAAVRERLDELRLTNVDLQLHEAGSVYTSTSAEFPNLPICTPLMG